jgi:hypothetical protein
MLTARRYRLSDLKAWNRQVRMSRNATFLFDRDYMDYHADRFEDHSLLFFVGEELLAVMPASVHGAEVRSHGGLTYGGIVSDHRMGAELMLGCFFVMCRHYAEEGFTGLFYKPVPHIYHARPAEEDLYALFRCGAKLVARGPSAAIDMASTDIPGKKRNGAKRGIGLGLVVRKVDDPAVLMGEIDRNLRARYGVPAVHTTDEMRRLAAAFPNQIETMQLEDGEGHLLGGAIVYLSAVVAHVQYMVVNDQGRPRRGMDVLVTDLVERYKGGCRYLDFGISSQENGIFLNTTLMAQKEGFAASVACYDGYQLNFQEALLCLGQSSERVFAYGQSCRNVSVQSRMSG